MTTQLKEQWRVMAVAFGSSLCLFTCLSCLADIKECEDNLIRKGDITSSFKANCRNVSWQSQTKGRDKTVTPAFQHEFYNILSVTFCTNDMLPLRYLAILRWACTAIWLIQV
jgi:hypothetical protein